MSRTISLALIAALGACNAQSAEPPNLEKNKQTIRRLYEQYINQSQRELLPELVANDYVGPDGKRGPSAFETTIDSIRGGFPDIRFHVEDLIAEGDRVTIRWKWSGKHTGTFNGFEATNKRIENTGIAIYELREGKVQKAWLQTDRLGFLQQLGVVSNELGRPPARR